MKTKYEYIYFEKYADKSKTSIWNCRNAESNALLGQVKWYGPWRQYCFFPAFSTVFHRGCLQDICHFIQKLMDERKEKKS